MEVSKFVQKCVTIRKDQEGFLANERTFKLSRFLQEKLDEYIRFRKEYSKFMEKEVKEDGEETTD